MTSPTTDRADRPIRLIAGTPPGGGQDRAARALAAAITAANGVQVGVSNLPGRGGGAAWSAVATERGRADLASISSPTLVTNSIHDAAEPGIDDLTHLALLCTEYIVFVTAEPTTPEGLLDRMASGSPVVAIATALGNVNHVAVSMVAEHAGGDAVGLDVRAFESARTAVAEVVAGRASLAAVSAASVLPEWTAGVVTPVAVSAPRRLEGPLASVPTWTELGIECVLGTWRGVLGPPGLDPAVIDRWNDWIASAVAHPNWRSALAEHLWSDTYLPSSDATRFVHSEDRRLRAALGEMELTGG